MFPDFVLTADGWMTSQILQLVPGVYYAVVILYRLQAPGSDWIGGTIADKGKTDPPTTVLGHHTYVAPINTP